MDLRNLEMKKYCPPPDLLDLLEELKIPHHLDKLKELGYDDVDDFENPLTMPPLPVLCRVKDTSREDALRAQLDILAACLAAANIDAEVLRAAEALAAEARARLELLSLHPTNWRRLKESLWARRASCAREIDAAAGVHGFASATDGPRALKGELAQPHDADVAARAAAKTFAAEVALSAGPPVLVEGAEHRATTLRKLKLLVKHVKQHSRSWVGRRWSDGALREERGLKPKDVTLYDVNLNLLAPLGAEFSVAYSELFARGQQPTPKALLSHAWSHPLLRTFDVLHAKDRGYGEDDPIWICASAIRQHAVEVGTSIFDSPFFKALKASAMKVIIISVEDAGVLTRSWCALEAFLALVEGGPGYLTDIYAHYEGAVRRLTDGLIAADETRVDTKASVDADRENILAHVKLQAGGEVSIDNTVRARYFVAALFAVVEAEDGAALVSSGMEALRRSVLPRLVLSDAIVEVHAHTLMRSLPSSVVELRLPGVGIGGKGPQILSTFLASSTALRVLDLSNNQIGSAGAAGLCEGLAANTTLTALTLRGNQIGAADAVGLGKGLAANASLTTLNLGYNQIGDAGAAGLGKGLAANTTLTTLSLDFNAIGAAAAVGLGEGLAANKALTTLDLMSNQIGDTGAAGLREGLAANASLTTLNLCDNQIGDAGAAGLSKGLSANASLTT
ncbi:hypothetical protein T492DRAFT_887439, partial [Pavlovales sp. CCMP2436]